MGYTTDESIAVELETYIVNDGTLYRERAKPMITNLAKKMAKGTYNRTEAVKLWRYLADAGAKAYNKEFGLGSSGYGPWTPAIRNMVAKELRDSYEEQVEDEASNIKAKRKKNPTRRRTNAGKYDWQKNISTGNYTAIVDSKVQLIRMAGRKPPYLYSARERGGSRDAIHGPVESTAKQAIASLHTMMKLRDRGQLGAPRRGTTKAPAAYLWDGVAYDVHTGDAYPASWSGYALSEDGKAVIRVGRSGGQRSFDVARTIRNPARR